MGALLLAPAVVQTCDCQLQLASLSELEIGLLAAVHVEHVNRSVEQKHDGAKNTTPKLSSLDKHIS